MQVGNGGTTGSIGSTASVSANGVLAFDRSDTITFSQAVSGSGGLVQLGTGAVTLTGSNSYSGGTTVNGGVLQFYGNRAVPGSGTVTVNSGGAVALAPAGSYSTVTGWLNSGKIAPASAGALH